MDIASIYSENGSKITNKNRSHFLKRMRSESIEEEEEDDDDDFLNPKSPKNQGFNTMISPSTEPKTKMLSFSDPGSHYYHCYKNGGFGHSFDFPHFDSYALNTGYGSGVHAPLLEGGLFTASQWAELRHQALIYKYIQANAVIPSGLLLGLKRSVSPYMFSGLHSGSYSYAPNSWGLGGSFHLGFSGNNNDPEPGRCRRTDGKKWRCSRDAVPEQKYCERHLNRGRHRSRKLVEGHAGQAVAGTGPTAAATSASVISSSAAASKSLVIPAQRPIKGLQPHAADNLSTADAKFNRIPDHQGPSVVNPATDSKSKDLNFSIPKQLVATEEPFHSSFGLVSSDSLVNPSIKSSHLNNTTSFYQVRPFNGNENCDQYTLRHFTDEEWPKGQSSRATLAEELKPEWTRLSMSIPMSLNISSTSSSSPQDKMALSPLSLSHELDPTQKEMNLVHMSWGNSMGGPLGEALLNNTSSSNAVALKNPPNGLWLGSSRTGVLQKTNLRSLSNSSGGSSPRGESKKINACGGTGDDVFGAHLTTSMFFPSL